MANKMCLPRGELERNKRRQTRNRKGGPNTMSLIS